MSKKKSLVQKSQIMKWLLSLLAIVILLLLLKTYYHKTVSNNYENTSIIPTISTNNWKLYEDEENGYSIKYPEDWNYQKVTIEGGSYEGGIMLGSSKISFVKNGATPQQTYRMARGNEQLVLEIITSDTISSLGESKKIEQTTIAGKPAIRLSVGAYVELVPGVVLSIYSPTYPQPAMEEILNSLVIQK